MFYPSPYCIDISGRRHLLSAGRPSRQVTVAQGFTMIELLVVITIITILFALLLPALRRARAEVDVIGCLNNLRTLATAQTLYQADNKEFFTPGYSFLDGINFYLGVSQSEFSSPKWIAGRNLGRLGFPYKCPTRNHAGVTNSVTVAANSAAYPSVSATARPYRVTRSDYGANSALHGLSHMDASLYAESRGSRFNLAGMGNAAAWRRTNEVKDPSRTLDMADASGSNPRMDYSTDVMTYPHRIGYNKYGITTKSTVINYADGHAKAWDIDEQYVSTSWTARNHVSSTWVSSGKYCVWY